MINKKQIIKDYKSQKQPAGIFAVHNLADNKMFIGTSKDLPAVLRRFELTLKMGSFPFDGLIEDYKKLGEKNFELKVLDELEINNSFHQIYRRKERCSSEKPIVPMRACGRNQNDW